jgi:hypothetical protein
MSDTFGVKNNQAAIGNHVGIEHGNQLFADLVVLSLSLIRCSRP